MKLKSTTLAGAIGAILVTFAAAPAFAGHKHMGHYGSGYHGYGYHGYGKGPMAYGPRYMARGGCCGMYGKRHGMHKGYGHRYGMKPGYGAKYGKGYGGSAQYGGGDQVAYEQAAEPAQKDIVATAIGAGSFTTLVSAVKAAGLVETLQGEGPFTVLAPTDDAFAKLPEDQVAALMGDPEALAGVLTYHVIAGELSAADLLEKGEVETVNGATLTLAQLDVSATDIQTSNGVVHVLDTVLLPPQ